MNSLIITYTSGEVEVHSAPTIRRIGLTDSGFFQYAVTSESGEIKSISLNKRTVKRIEFVTQKVKK